MGRHKSDMLSWLQLCCRGALDERLLYFNARLPTEKDLLVTHQVGEMLLSWQPPHLMDKVSSYSIMHILGICSFEMWFNLSLHTKSHTQTRVWSVNSGSCRVYGSRWIWWGVDSKSIRSCYIYLSYCNPSLWIYHLFSVLKVIQDPL